MKQHSYFLIEGYCIVYTQAETRCMSDCTLDFILPTSQLYKTSSWALRHHLFSSFFSFFCCTDGNHLLQRRPWTNLFCCRFLYSGLWMVGHILTWCWTGSGFCVVHKIFTHRGIHKAVNISRTASLFHRLFVCFWVFIEGLRFLDDDTLIMFKFQL